MSHELLYTSVPPGLIAGVKGYSTVASTSDMPPQLTQLLEQSLSDYRYSAEGNPGVVWSHLRVREGLRELSVLTRKTPVNDHSGRPSVFAHHVVLGPDELPQGGPAWVLQQRLPGRQSPEFLLPAWDGFVGTLPAGRTPPRGDRAPGKCTAWEYAGLDPGWAGVLAEAFLAAPDQPSFVIARPDQDLLPLIADAVALLPVERRWSLTFSTYFTGLPPKVPCAWRGVLADSKEAQQAARLGRGVVLDLEHPGEPQGEGLVELARTGRQTTRTVVKPAAAFTPVRSGSGAKAATGGGVAGSPLDLSEGLDQTPDPATGRRGPLIAAVGAGAALVVLLVGLLAWYALRPDPSLAMAEQSARKLESELVQESPPVAPASKETSEPAPEDSAPRPETEKKAPEPVAKAEPEPEPEPDPATAPVKEARSANADLPVMSDIPARHDSADHVLDVPLPTARRFALGLRGLDDPETRNHELVAQPAEDGRTDTLTIAKDPTKGGGKMETRVKKMTLARFWIEGNRLHFRWEPNLGRTLVEPAQSLRDCVLEVRGGGAQLNVGLRGLWKDPAALTVQQGPKHIPWEKYGRPSRKLAIRSCEVKTDKGWEEIPSAGGDPNHRLRLLAGEKDDPPLHLLTLTVRLGDDVKTLAPELTPPAAKVKDLITALEREDNALTDGINRKIENIKNTNKRLRYLGNQKSQQTTLLAQTRIDISNNIPPNPLATPEIILTNINTLDIQIKNTDIILVGLNDRLVQDRRQHGEVKSELERQTERLKQAEAFQKAPIRVRLGITIEGEEVDLAQIGPW
jgi:hypothetical protein